MAITENSGVSFGLLMLVGGGILTGYHSVLNARFEADTAQVSIKNLEARVAALESKQTDIQTMKTDIAVIRSNLEHIQQDLPLSQGRK